MEFIIGEISFGDIFHSYSTTIFFIIEQFKFVFFVTIIHKTFEHMIFIVLGTDMRLKVSEISI
jgi:hypothetical protein